MGVTMDYRQIEKSEKRHRRITHTLVYILLIFWALVVLFPFYWMLLTSVKSYGSYNAERVPAFWPISPTLQNYADAFTTVPLAGYLLNTLIFTLATTAIMLVVITQIGRASCRERV